jgi:hypothetical protein
MRRALGVEIPGRSARPAAGRSNWCPIKPALRVDDPLHRYHEFLEYGDADGYRPRLAEFRDWLRG